MVDLTVLLALSTIASEQSKATKNTMQKTNQLLDYLATHSEATVRFHAFTWMRLACPKQTPTAEHVDTSIWDGNLIPPGPSN